MVILATLDPGSRWCGLAAAPEDKSGPLLTSQLESNEDHDITAAAIVAWLVSVGASELTIEWAHFWANGKPGADMARHREREAMSPLVYAVAALCRESGIVAASKFTIKKCHGPGLMSVSRWRSIIGANVEFDPVTKRAKGTKDAAVSAALVRYLGPEALVTMRTDHQRDAAGMLVARILTGATPETASEPGERRRGKRVHSEHRAAAGRRRALESYRRRARDINAARRDGRALARAARGEPPLRRDTLARALALLAGCPGGARARWMAAQLDLPPTQVAANLARAVRDGIVTQPERGVYALTQNP